jgi:hypothetical protein
MRASASHRTEMTSQLLFGERAEALGKEDKGWLHVRGLHDGYEGWVRDGQLQAMTVKEARKATRCLVTSHDSRLVFERGIMRLPLGAELPGLANGMLSVGGMKATFKGKKLGLKERTLSSKALIAAAAEALHAPYLWGGRTVYGIDCSGLIQLAFKLCGVLLPRDAWQQAEAGTSVDFLLEAKPGDVAFFSNDDGRIVHTGILLDANTILHATETSGRAVIDRIDTEGIISVSLRRRTHRLRTIRRYF